MASEPPTDVILDVHAKEEATPSDLITLGKALADLRSQEPRITGIEGIEALLEGRYPAPCEVFNMVPDPDGEIDMGPRGRFRIPRPWLQCFARVRARNMTEPELVAVLQRCVGVVGDVVAMNTGHW